tara:strand:+ start:896 stop:1291 length:396 start_codon:yes stop_codon:yes gene_type:complete
MQKNNIKKSKTIKKKSKGLGDTVAKVTKATGIDKAVKFIAGEECGCEKRKEALNKLFPYNQPECLKENEYNFLKEFFSIQRNTVSYQQQLELIAISNRSLHTKLEPSSCSSCIKSLMQKLKKLYDNYEIKP